MQMIARMLREPLLHRRSLVRADVVENEMHVQVRQTGSLVCPDARATAPAVIVSRGYLVLGPGRSGRSALRHL